MQIVDTRTGRVIQKIVIPGASGGVALDASHHRAYVSGEPNPDIPVFRAPKGEPGTDGDVIHVFRWSARTGKAHELHDLPVPPPSNAPDVDSFPPAVPPKQMSWPERLAVSPNGKTLLVALGLADNAAIVNTKTGAVDYVPTGSHPFGAAILPDGKTGLVTNRGPGTVSVIDLATATKVKDIQAGPHLSHPEAITLSPSRNRAYVPLTNDDAVAVIDTKNMTLRRRLNVEVPQGPGGSPESRSRLSAARARCRVRGGRDRGLRRQGKLVGRIPTADYPTDVSIGPAVRGAASGAKRARPTLLWTAAKGFGLGPNAGKPFTSQYFEIPAPLTTKGLVTGYAGIGPLPSEGEAPPADADVERPAAPLQRAAARRPARRCARRADQARLLHRAREPHLRPDPGRRLARRRRPEARAVRQAGHARTCTRSSSASRCSTTSTPNSEASIDGHFWTSAAKVSDYVHKNWHQNYAGRGRPYDFGVYASPGRERVPVRPGRAAGHLVLQLRRGGRRRGAAVPRQGPHAPRTTAQVTRSSRSPTSAPARRCYPNDAFIGKNAITGSTTSSDSTPPAGAPPARESRFDCFKQRFHAAGRARTRVPAFNYMVLPNDHTEGATPGRRTPRAMVADNDYGLGQIVDLISHSSIWKSSAIFVVEDDSQDGADHVDAHRIPAAVISPYAKRGAVVHTRYDFLSVIRSIELILGIEPLGLFDAQGDADVRRVHRQARERRAVHRRRADLPPRREEPREPKPTRGCRSRFAPTTRPPRPGSPARARPDPLAVGPRRELDAAPAGPGRRGRILGRPGRLSAYSESSTTIRLFASGSRTRTSAGPGRPSGETSSSTSTPASRSRGMCRVDVVGLQAMPVSLLPTLRRLLRGRRRQRHGVRPQRPATRPRSSASCSGGPTPVGRLLEAELADVELDRLVGVVGRRTITVPTFVDSCPRCGGSHFDSSRWVGRFGDVDRAPPGN